MKTLYALTIKTENGTLYFNHEFAKFMVKCGTRYTSKKTAEQSIKYASIVAPNTNKIEVITE